jgi:hypothetical protein
VSATCIIFDVKERVGGLNIDHDDIVYILYVNNNMEEL